MDLKKLLETSPETLAALQFDELKKHVKKTLQGVLSAIEKDDFKKIREFCSFSSAGDGYGCDNHFIDFSPDQSKTQDIIEVCEQLERLKEIKENKTGHARNRCGRRILSEF